MIHVLIERHIADGMETTYEAHAKETLHEAYSAEGFINGETFYNMQHSNHRYVLSKWRSILDWKRWQSSEARQNMMNQLNPILDGAEKITLLEN